MRVVLQKLPVIGEVFVKKRYGIQIPPMTWHTIEVHESSTILEAKDRKSERNTGTGSCFVEKGIELQAEMSVAQFFL